MKNFKKISLLLVVLLVVFTSCSYDDDNSEPQYQGETPSVEKTFITVGEELAISYSDTEEDGFSYEITDGEEFITVIEQDSMHYIQGVEPGDGAITLTNKAGDASLTITVISEVEIEGDYYVDYQGIRYNIDLENDIASVAGNPDGSFIGANYDVDFDQVDGILTIPANIYYEGREYPVKSIEEYAFSNASTYDGNSSLRYLKFAEGSRITSIGYRAFPDSPNLQSVNFNNCTELTTIESVTFMNCNKLESVNLSGCASLASIGESAFRESQNLTSVDFTGCTSLEAIGESVFYYCSNLGSVNLEECTEVNFIGKFAFMNCSNDITVTLPDFTTPGMSWYPSGTITESNWDEDFSVYQLIDPPTDPNRF